MTLKVRMEDRTLRWVHAKLPGFYWPKDEGRKGFVLSNSTRMLRFDSRGEAIEKGWTEEKPRGDYGSKNYR